jgi:lipoprotein NlpI
MPVASSSRLAIRHLMLGWLMLMSSGTIHGADAAPEKPNADQWFREGVRLFFDAQVAASATAFDKVIELAPAAAPQLWQRGLSLYYAGRFAEGRAQFELHQTVNGNDVENAAWHFLCVVKVDGIDAARKAFIPIVGDGRVPMSEIHALFAGTGSADVVLKAADVDGIPTEAERDQLCYAHLYLGLYYEVTGDAALARTHMRRAAIDYRMDHYMGRVSQVHLKVRGWQDAALPTKTDAPVPAP